MSVDVHVSLSPTYTRVGCAIGVEGTDAEGEVSVWLDDCSFGLVPTGDDDSTRAQLVRMAAIFQKINHAIAERLAALP